MYHRHTRTRGRRNGHSARHIFLVKNDPRGSSHPRSRVLHAPLFFRAFRPSLTHTVTHHTHAAADAAPDRLGPDRRVPGDARPPARLPRARPGLRRRDEHRRVRLHARRRARRAHALCLRLRPSRRVVPAPAPPRGRGRRPDLPLRPRLRHGRTRLRLPVRPAPRRARAAGSTRGGRPRRRGRRVDAGQPLVLDVPTAALAGVPAHRNRALDPAAKAEAVEPAWSSASRASTWPAARRAHDAARGADRRAAAASAHGAPAPHRRPPPPPAPRPF